MSAGRATSRSDRTVRAAPRPGSMPPAPASFPLPTFPNATPTPGPVVVALALGLAPPLVLQACPLLSTSLLLVAPTPPLRAEPRGKGKEREASAELREHRTRCCGAGEFFLVRVR